MALGARPTALPFHARLFPMPLGLKSGLCHRKQNSPPLSSHLMPIISVDNLAKSFRVSASQPGFKNTLKHFFRRQYRSVDAVKPLSFSIEPGEIVGFLGPNGAGK